MLQRTIEFPSIMHAGADANRLDMELRRVLVMVGIVHGWSLPIGYRPSPAEGHLVAVVTADDTYTAHLLREKQAEIQDGVLQGLGPAEPDGAAKPGNGDQNGDQPGDTTIVLSVLLGATLLALCAVVVCVARLNRRVTAYKHEAQVRWRGGKSPANESGTAGSPTPEYPPGYTMPVLPGATDRSVRGTGVGGDKYVDGEHEVRGRVFAEDDIDLTLRGEYIDVADGGAAGAEEAGYDQALGDREVAMKRRGEFLTTRETDAVTPSRSRAFAAATATAAYTPAPAPHTYEPDSERAGPAPSAWSGLATPPRRDSFGSFLPGGGIAAQRAATNSMLASAFDMILPPLVGPDAATPSPSTGTGTGMGSHYHHRLPRYSDVEVELENEGEDTRLWPEFLTGLFSQAST